MKSANLFTVSCLEPTFHHFTLETANVYSKCVGSCRNLDPTFCHGKAGVVRRKGFCWQILVDRRLRIMTMFSSVTRVWEYLKSVGIAKKNIYISTATVLWLPTPVPTSGFWIKEVRLFSVPPPIIARFQVEISATRDPEQFRRRWWSCGRPPRGREANAQSPGDHAWLQHAKELPQGGQVWQMYRGLEEG